MYKKLVAAYSVVLSLHLPGGTEENQYELIKTVGDAPEIRIGHFPYQVRNIVA
jgi:hypothetical protein